MDDESKSNVQAEGRTQGAGHTLSAKQAIAITVVFILAEIAVGAAFGIAVGIHLGLTRGHVDTAALAQELAPFTLPMSILGLVVAGVLALWMTRRILGPIGRGALAPLGWRPSAAPQVAAAALAGCVLSLVYLFILVPAGPQEVQQSGPLASAVMSGGWSRILWAILAVALAPPIEEFVFRGVLLGGLSNALGIPAATVIATVVFVVMHATEALAYWPAWVGISMMACVLAAIRIKTGSLVPAVAAHAGYNLMLVIAVYLGPA